jgi:tetratricopeptide (TPR) repeat protein
MISTYVLIVLFVLIFIAIIVFIVRNRIIQKKDKEIPKLIADGETKLAIKKLNQLLEKDNRDPYTHYLLAEAYRVDGNNQFAILEYKQVLKFGRFDDKIKEIKIRSALVKIYKEKKSFDEAKKELLILTKLDSSNFEVFFDLGVILFNQ